MKRSLLLAIALAALPLPAFADVTAHYKTGQSGFTVEIDNAGDVRLEVPGKFTEIRRDGADYVVLTLGGATKVLRLDDLITFAHDKLAKSPAGKSPIDIKLPGAPALIDGGVGTAAGVTGTVWAVETGDGKTAKLLGVALLSPDPRLTPVGDCFRRTLALLADLFTPVAGPDGALAFRTLKDLFAKGTVIRINRELELEFDRCRADRPAPVRPAGAGAVRRRSADAFREADADARGEGRLAQAGRAASLSRAFRSPGVPRPEAGPGRSGIWPAPRSPAAAAPIPAVR